MLRYESKVAIPSHARNVLPGPDVLTSLQNRPTRFDLRSPISFIVGDLELTGHCVNVSETGLLVTFDQPIELWISGEILLVAGDYYLNIKARVARTQGLDSGMSFLIETDNDRLTIQILVDFAIHKSRSPKEALPVP